MVACAVACAVSWDTSLAFSFPFGKVETDVKLAKSLMSKTSFAALTSSFKAAGSPGGSNVDVRRVLVLGFV